MQISARQAKPVTRRSLIIVWLTLSLCLSAFADANAQSAGKPAEVSEPLLAGITKMAEESAAPLLNFFKVHLTRYELSGLVQAISAKAMTSRSIPSAQNFQQYVRDTMQSSRDPSLDYWKTPYAFQRNGKIGAVFSAGPDRRYGTADDIRQEFELP